MASQLYTDPIKRIHNIAFYCSCDNWKKRNNKIPWETRQKFNLEKYRDKLDNIDWGLRGEVKKHLAEISKLCHQLATARGGINAVQIRKRVDIVDKMKRINKIISEKTLV